MGTPIGRQPEPEVMAAPAEAAAYARADFAGVNQAFVQRLLELAGPLERALAVDLGAGPADIPVRVASVRPGWRLVAIEASTAMLAHARQTVARAGLASRIDLIQSDAKVVGLAGAAFDVVFSNSILHHISDTARLWAEVRRLARPGALIFFRDLARPSSAAAARAIVDRYAGTESALLQEEYFRSLLSSYTPAEVRAQLDQTGLSILQVVMATDRHLDVFGRLA